MAYTKIRSDKEKFVGLYHKHEDAVKAIVIEQITNNPYCYPVVDIYENVPIEDEDWNFVEHYFEQLYPEFLEFKKLEDRLQVVNSYNDFVKEFKEDLIKMFTKPGYSRLFVSRTEGGFVRECEVQ